ncbi:hypothetical protein SELMODRAFT_430175 [Selaginella moellendorffii]|uniref:Uncharacterized protein n=1 Tax=Selaginella moellendorffii TaxID=88036 RepID=D8T8K9_SELML|nr:hypothetical protein SELMODRAFT_430175 [Selaginella moellendorffii]
MQALQAGLLEAKDSKWSKPWKYEDFFHKKVAKALEAVNGTDDKGDVLEEVESNITYDDEELAASLELQHTFDSMIDEEALPQPQMPQQEKFKLFVALLPKAENSLAEVVRVGIHSNAVYGKLEDFWTSCDARNAGNCRMFVDALDSQLDVEYHDHGNCPLATTQLEGMDEDMAEKVDDEHPTYRWLWPHTGEVFWQGILERERQERYNMKLERKRRNKERLARMCSRYKQKSLGRYVKSPPEEMEQDQAVNTAAR